MAHRELVLPAYRLAFVELSGRVDRSDLFDVLHSLEEKDWEASFDVICEATGVRELILLPGELEKFISMLSMLGEGEQEHGMVAVVVERPLDYETALFYKALAARHSFHVEVCWSREGAYECLKLDDASEAIERELEQRDL